MNVDRLFLDLRSYSSEERLYRDLFESDKFRGWVNSPRTLELVLDSLDECMLHVRTVASMLVDEFGKYPTSRLHLRMACRTAEWPELLRDELRGLWGQDKFGEYELAPLRRCDAAEYATSQAICPDSFLTEVDRRDAGVLASKPLTLQMLVKLFQESEVLPERRTDLFEAACRVMCRDPSLSRRASRASGSLPVEHRLAIAERIAAITLLSMRSAVLMGSDVGEATETDVAMAELMTGEEVVDGLSLRLDEARIREVLDTGLFSSRGPGRMGWAHWNYAEYLCARFLSRRQFTLPQLRGLLLRMDSSGETRVIPQLAEVNSWVSSLEPQWFAEILPRDPLVLLRSDMVVENVASRKQAVTALLAAFDTGRVTDQDRRLRERYRHLEHPELAGQLLPFILDKRKNIVVRRAAIEMAEACGTVGLVDQLLQVALDSVENSHIRHKAVRAVAELGSGEQVLRLHPLLDAPYDEDRDDEIRGAALSALADQLTVSEIFERMLAPRRSNLLGSYSVFLLYELPKRLSASDLPVALEWVKARARHPRCDFKIRELAGKIMNLAWAHLEDPAVLAKFSEVAANRIRQHEAVLEGRAGKREEDLVQKDTDRRRLLVHSLLRHVDPEEGQGLTWIRVACAGVVGHEDLPWVLEQIRTADDSGDLHKLADLASTIFRWDVPGHFEIIHEAVAKFPSVEKRFGKEYNFVRLDSPEAKQARKRQADDRRWKRRRKKEEEEPKLKQPLETIIRDWLDRFEAGDSAAWWRMNLDMTIEPPSARYPPGAEWKEDLTCLPGWECLGVEDRGRCVDAAEKYLRSADPATHEWLGTNTFHRPAMAGYRAIRLLWGQRPKSLLGLAPSIWAKWSAAVLAFPESAAGDGSAPVEIIAAIAYRAAPKELTDTLMALVDKDNQAHGTVFIVRKVANCWDERLSLAVLEKLQQDSSLKPGAVGDLLRAVLPHLTTEAVRFSVELLSRPARDEDTAQIRLEAATALLAQAPFESWSFLWDLLQNDAEFGRDVFLKLGHHHDRDAAASLVENLEEGKVADLYLWLARQFPHDSDPQIDEAHAVGERESVARFRDELLARLKGKGSTEAVIAVRRIVVGLPSVGYLRWAIQEAESVRLSQEWSGIAPRTLLMLADNNRARLIDNGGQLVHTILESLARLQELLQGELPAAEDLWNDGGTPKGEAHFSDYIARHLCRDLTQRGVIVNREVQVRRGQFSDIRVDALGSAESKGEIRRISVIVEAKGCWNRGVKTAMGHQLVDRYMRLNGCNFGIYLVGWFRCPVWTDDYRQRQTPKWSAKEAQAFFDDQAAQLSRGTSLVRAFVLDVGKW